MSHPLDLFTYCPRCGSSHFVENNASPKRCETCGFIYYSNPKTATVGLIFNSRGELLVCKRSHYPCSGMLDLPGGFTECGETAEEAIKREVLEETGLVISKLKYLFSRPNIYPYSGLAIHTMDLFFLCEVENDSVVIPQDDVSACYWANMNELDLNDFAFESIRSGIKYLTDYKERDGNH